MDYIILDNSDEIERAENQLFFTFQQEFTQKINFTKRYGNKHIENPKYYSKSKRIWFSRIKRNFESHYFFGFNYDESEKGFDAGKTILFLNFNIFGEKNNSHFLKDLNTNEIHCGINIYYRNYQSKACTFCLKIVCTDKVKVFLYKFGTAVFLHVLCFHGKAA